MELAYPPNQIEVMAWINSTLTNCIKPVKELQEMANGVAYLHVLCQIFPSAINHSQIIHKPKDYQQIVANYHRFFEIFQREDISFTLNVYIKQDRSNNQPIPAYTNTLKSAYSSLRFGRPKQPTSIIKNNQFQRIKIIPPSKIKTLLLQRGLKAQITLLELQSLNTKPKLNQILFQRKQIKMVHIKYKRRNYSQIYKLLFSKRKINETQNKRFLYFQTPIIKKIAKTSQIYIQILKKESPYNLYRIHSPYWSIHYSVLVSFELIYVNQQAPLLKYQKSVFKAGFMLNCYEDEEIIDDLTIAQLSVGYSHLQELFKQERQPIDEMKRLKEMVKNMLKIKSHWFIHIFLGIYNEIVGEIKHIQQKQVVEMEKRVIVVDTIAEKVKKFVSSINRMFKRIPQLSDTKYNTEMLLKVTVYCFIAEHFYFHANQLWPIVFPNYHLDEEEQSEAN